REVDLSTGCLTDLHLLSIMSLTPRVHPSCRKPLCKTLSLSHTHTHTHTQTWEYSHTHTQMGILTLTDMTQTIHQHAIGATWPDYHHTSEASQRKPRMET